MRRSAGRRGALGFVLIALAASAVGYCALRPVCLPLSSQDLAQFNASIETRSDRDLYLRVFQLHGDRWYQCKTWLSRQLFF